jgi:hypothetical protein
LGHFCCLRSGLIERLFVFLVLREVEKETGLFKPCPILLAGFQNLSKASLLFKNSLSFFSVVPEIGPGCGEI